MTESEASPKVEKKESINDFVDEVNISDAVLREQALINKEKFGKRALGSPLPNFMAITMAPPNSPSWNNKQSFQQKKQLLKWFNVMAMNLNPICHEKECHLCFEYHQNGNIHAHGYISFPGVFCIQGVIADLARTYLTLQKKWYKPDCYYTQYNRYREPSLCIQYMDTVEEQQRWITYIMKDQGYQN